MSGATKEVEKERVVLVEGLDEVKVLSRLLEHLGRTDVQVLDVAGKTNFESNAKAKQVKLRRLVSLAVIRDADYAEVGAQHSAFHSAWESVCGVLRVIGFQVPDRDQPDVFAPEMSGLPKTGVFIMPNNRDDGMLEDVLLASVKDKTALPCVESYFGCLSDKEIRPRADRKARLLAYLASRAESTEGRTGLAADKGVFDWEAPALAPLVKFLRQM